MSLGMQEWIHRLEEGGGVRFVKGFTLTVALVVLALTWNSRHYQNFSNPEAMDAAQVARNVAEGRGFTTQFLRPVSLWMMKQKSGDMKLEAHPDLANAPLYPWLLAGWMRAWPVDAPTAETREFRTFAPEVRLVWLNEGLFFVALWLVFRLARRLFDEPVAWLSTVVMAGMDTWWRFSNSGLSTMLLLVLFLLVVTCLVVLEQGAREQKWGGLRLGLLALLAGALLGACGLTRYACLCLVVPVLVFVTTALERCKLPLAVALLVGFGSVVAPWLVRNHQLSGSLFGTAGLAVFEDTLRFPGNRLERSLNPANPDLSTDIQKVDMWEHWQKLLDNMPGLLQYDLPRLGGSWVIAFFLVGLLVPFRSPALSRLRWFLLLSIGFLAVLQVLGRTQLSVLSPDISSENLLILLAPLMVVYGVGLYITLLDQMGVGHPALRNLANGLFVLLGCAPLVFRLAGNPASPLVYPPYYPPAVQECAGWLGKDELMISDIPWAVAWYGQRHCVWLTADIQNEFRAIHERKPIAGVYLTQFTTDGRLLSDLTLGREQDWAKKALKSIVREDPGVKDVVWGNFAWNAVMKEEVPEGFPLKESPSPMTLVGSLFPGQLFLTDRKRW
jgi:hypothetical protein